MVAVVLAVFAVLAFRQAGLGAQALGLVKPDRIGAVRMAVFGFDHKLQDKCKKLFNNELIQLSYENKISQLKHQFDIIDSLIYKNNKHTLHFFMKP